VGLELFSFERGNEVLDIVASDDPQHLERDVYVWSKAHRAGVCNRGFIHPADPDDVVRVTELVDIWLRHLESVGIGVIRRGKIVR